jgi:hypothetical protein
MGSWGRKDGVELTGTGSIAEGTNVIIGTSTLFTEEVELRELVDLDGELYVVESIIDDTEMVVIPFAAANVAGEDILLSQVPKYLPVDVKLGIAEGFDTSGVFLHQTDDAVDGTGRDLGIKTPGWTQSFTYTDTNGNTRRIVETLVAMKQTTEN